MPSPFPGMDPFLEDPTHFPGLQFRMVVGLTEVLQPRLPAPYFADLGQRAWVEYHHDESRQIFAEIRALHDDGERIVTIIEVLDSDNKIPGEHSRDLYLQMQREWLDGRTHLVEIDLLRGGIHSTAVPRHRLLAAAGPFDYHVSVHRFDRFEDFFVYPIRLEERLPEVAIPLLPGDPDVSIDLQAVFDRCYDAGPYRRRVRYAEVTPVPPLRPDQAEWAARLLSPPGEPRP